MMVSLRFPSFFVCFLIFIAWMHYKKRKATKQQEKESSLFWEREEEANHTFYPGYHKDSLGRSPK